MSSPSRTSPLADQAAEAFRAHRDGYPGAMDDLVTLLTAPLWSVARSAGLSESQAEDVVQTAWLRLVQRIDSIDEPQAVFAWLLTTVRRESWRAAAALRTTTAVPEERPDTEHPSPDETAEVDDEADRLWRHIRRLNPRCQALLRVIAYAATPDYASISVALGMPMGSIGPTRGRCLASLRKSLNDDPSWTLT